MKVLVIGSGLGGLLSAAWLSRKGHEVDVFERLPIIGGRFTNIEYKGFQLSTGALHMIPHGPTGPLGTLLKDLGADVKIVRSNPMTTIRIPKNKDATDYTQGFQDIEFHDFRKRFSLFNRIKLAILITTTRTFPPKSGSMAQWCSKNLKQDWALKLADSFCGWSLSLKAENVPATEVFEIIENMYRYSGPGIPMGGCQAVTEALINVISSHGGKIHTSTEVTQILVENGKAVGLMADANEYRADLVISDIGHMETSRLYDANILGTNAASYLASIRKLRPSAGVKICLSSNEPLIGHTGVLLTPYARRINGIDEVTNVDPSLAPAGKHLIMAHQCVQWENIGRLEEEIDLGLRDLSEIFTGKEYEVILIQSYSGEWPVNRSSSGSDLSNRTPIEGLYIVGDSAKGKGGIEVDGIALGVRTAINDILNSN
ncbi:NAD(P)/FAD-dependent oxidoreductase [uncultured Methanomethylovorans sp.]|uniref:phytoene desaturase family protein n=1 Tax=uncultured Methanomethylovorans sp. TaxID=183759 RepID=UPI002AA74F81|nr:NAD(P)/FAD-dependent oxidoreductase [uncultured Methanomethylovorans sp.]